MAKIDVSTLTSFQHQLQLNVRNFLLVATPEELEISLEQKDEWRAKFVQELIDERTEGK
jgi:hypothetical protein